MISFWVEDVDCSKEEAEEMVNEAIMKGVKEILVEKSSVASGSTPPLTPDNSKMGLKKNRTKCTLKGLL